MPKIIQRAFFVILSLVFIFSLSQAASATFGTTSTYLGAIYRGDGGPATEGYLDFSEDLVRDSDGNFYIADTYNNVIRKINSEGIISTYAGTGAYGDKIGDKGDAKFALPSGVTVDGNGIVYVSDTFNNKIKKISGGQVTTIANGDNFSYPDGLAIIGDNVYVSDSGNSAIKTVSKNGGTVTTIATGINIPTKLTGSESGEYLYLAATGDHKVVKVKISDGSVSTIAGSGTDGYKEGTGTGADFEDVTGIFLERSTNYLYVTDGNGYTDRLRKINLSNNETSLVATDEVMATINFPKALTLVSNTIYVMNTGISTIQKINKNTGSSEEKYAGKDRFGNTFGGPSVSTLGRPTFMLFSPGKKYIYLAQNNKVDRIDYQTKELTAVAGNVVDYYEEGTGSVANFSHVAGLAINSSGDTLYTSDHNNNKIRKIDLNTNTTYLISGAGTCFTPSCNGYSEGTKETAHFSNPSGIAITQDNQYLYVADESNNRIRKVRISDGQTWLVAGSGVAGFNDGPSNEAKFNGPNGIVLDNEQNYLYVADTKNNRLRRVKLSDGSVSTVAGKGNNGFLDGLGTKAVLSLPNYLTIDSDDKIYFSEISQRIRYFDPATGSVRTVAGSVRGFENGARFAAQFNTPRGLLVDKSNNTLYVADQLNDQIRSVNITGGVPFADPAPKITAVKPNWKYKVAGKDSDTKNLSVTGENLRYGAKISFSGYDATKNYFVDSHKINIVLPFGQMPIGWYDVTVTNIDGQTGTKTDGFVVLNPDGSLPPKNQEPTKSTSDFFVTSPVNKEYTIDSGNFLQDISAEILAIVGNRIKIFDDQGRIKTQFLTFSKNLRSGVKVAACDFNGDGYDEIITVPGRGYSPEVRVYSGTGDRIGKSFYAFKRSFKNGVNLSCGDVNGDKKLEIIAATSKGARPRIAIYRQDGHRIKTVNVLSAKISTGVTIATGDLNNDGTSEIIVGNENGGSRVQIYYYRKGKFVRTMKDFYPFSGFKGGLSLAAGDVNGDGKYEVVIGKRTEGRSDIKIYRHGSKKMMQIKKILAYRTTYNGGVTVTSHDVDNDNKAEVITVPTKAKKIQVKVFDIR